jgi:hypothetical protein
MRRRLIFLLICIITSSCCQYKLNNILNNAYSKKDIQLLESLFKKWESQQNSISDQNLALFSDTVQDVYEIYKDFYKPFNLNRMGSQNWGDSVYFGKKYYIIQPTCCYSFTPTLDKKRIILNSLEKYKSDSTNYNKYLDYYLRDTSDFTVWNYREDNIIFYSEKAITNFRPKLEFLDAIPLYYDQKYCNAIAQFISYKQNKFNIKIKNGNTNEIESKWQFINQLIYIYPGHWGNYWEIETCPYIKTIVFDYERTTAMIFFSLFYHGGQALYKKTNGKWTFIQSKLTSYQ